ncbi:MAG: type II toxin-antitoxin system RelB/DinJ family antitoxin [bacterium]|nr:type II toxin-antitoxin system RelB/DinJ family antitoxin [bacterium]
MKLDDRISTRIDRELKQSAVKVFERLGITEGEAIRMFYAQVNLHQGMPFGVKIPNRETIEAMKEGESSETLQSFRRFSDLRKKAGV